MIRECDLGRIETKLDALKERLEALALSLSGLDRPILWQRPAELDGHVFDDAASRPPGRPARGPVLRHPSPPLPDPRLVHRIIRQRRLRERYFEKELFAEPAWDILLDLTAARAEHRMVSITSLCIAAAVPPTTGLRWIAVMEEMGLLIRREDPNDRRRAFISMSDDAARAMAAYFDEIGVAAKSLT